MFKDSTGRQRCQLSFEMVFGLICMEIDNTRGWKHLWADDSAPLHLLDRPNIPALLGLNKVKHTYPEIWKKYGDDTRLRFCVGIDLCHILVGKNQKNQIFSSAPAEISQFQNMASIKTNKIKKRMTLLHINFWKLTTLLFCPKWFIHFKSPKNAICLWLSHNKEHCKLDMQCALSWAQPKTNYIFRSFRVNESFWTKKQSCKFSKVDIK